VEVVKESLPIGLAPPAGLPAAWICTGVAVSESGTIYFSADQEDALYRIIERRKFEYPG
jgi:hypothetical protein